MAGMNGFTHHCLEQKVSKSANKKPLSESLYSYAQIDTLWDFYVTHAISGGTGMTRDITSYGWSKNDNKTTGYQAIENKMIEAAGLENNICFIRAKTCKDTLNAMDLSNDMICISHPRAVLLQRYTTTIDENERIQFGGGSGSENHVSCLFRHIRNAFAHGNTYFFENKYVLLEDKDNSAITAEILIKQQTLLDWIRVIDKEERYYILIDTCAKCKSGEK